MAQKIKGKCKFCGKEYTFGYMNKHLPTCKVRQERLAAEKGKKQCGYFELAICSGYLSAGYLAGMLRASECI